MTSNWSGVFAIPVTPFRTNLAIDWDSLGNEIDFCLAAGVHGIVYPAVVSEFFTLDLEERIGALQLVIDRVGGRVPVIAGVSAPSSPYAAKLARNAEGLGADGVMTMLPYVHHFYSPTLDFAIRHLTLVADAGLPVIFQNARIGYPLPVDQLPAVLRVVPQVRAIKEETSPSTHQLGRAIQALKEHAVDVFGGLGGIYLLEEIARGAVGTMPAPPFVDVLVDAYGAAIGGDLAGARATLDACAPAFTYELLYNIGFIKEILVKRGVISSALCRVPAPAMDEVDKREIDAILEVLDPRLRAVRYGNR